LRYSNVHTVYLDALTGARTSPSPAADAFVVGHGNSLRGTAHLGLGFSFDFTSHLYLRTDLRYRHHLNTPDFLDSDSVESSFGVGWRF
jgi:hypothetical protein